MPHLIILSRNLDKMNRNRVHKLAIFFNCEGNEMGGMFISFLIK